jgi:hypothetical protein
LGRFTRASLVKTVSYAGFGYLDRSLIGRSDHSELQAGQIDLLGRSSDGEQGKESADAYQTTL